MRSSSTARGHEIEASGLAPGFRALLGDVWRERGFGDFWGYALLAEGAAEAMVEVGLSAWDAAAPLVLIEEAGGRATDFEGRRESTMRHVCRLERDPPRRHPEPTARRRTRGLMEDRSVPQSPAERPIATADDPHRPVDRRISVTRER